MNRLVTDTGVLLQRLSSEHEGGIQRAIRVACQTPNYADILLGKVASHHVEMFDNQPDGAAKAQMAIAENRVGLKSARARSIRLRDKSIACFGSTKNNIREFRFFADLIGMNQDDLLKHNLATFERFDLPPNTAVIEPIKNFLMSGVERFYSSFQSFNSSIFHQQMLFTRSFFNYALSVLDPQAVLPRVLVISNDHMPTHVAVSAALKAANVPRVYMQHAEVSNAFPPLDFEYSVLRSERALDVYKKIGPVPGRVFVLPRATVDVSVDALRGDKKAPFPVVLYPTARSRDDELRSAVTTLKRNAAVQSIYVKPHPNASPPLNEVLAGIELEYLQETPTFDHIAIVGNSSIAIELLCLGIQVYQCFEIDPVRRDYYQFVADGIVPEAPLTTLGGKFWSDYPVGKRWLTNFRKRVPANDEEAARQKELFRSEMLRISGYSVGEKHAAIINPRLKIVDALNFFIRLNPDFSWKLSRRIRKTLISEGYRKPFKPAPHEKRTASDHNANLFAEAFPLVRDPTEFINRVLSAGRLSESELLIALERLFEKRTPAINDVFRNASMLPDGGVRTWVELKKAQWTLASPAAADLTNLANHVYGFASDRRSKRILESGLLSVLLQYGSKAEIDRFLANVPHLPPSKWSLNRQIALLHRLFNLGVAEEEIAQLRLSFESDATPFNGLKLRNMDALSGKAPPNWRHAEAEHEFASLAPHAVSLEFRTMLAPVYNRLRSRMQIIDVRNDVRQREEAIDLLSAALRERRAYSVLRLSDGEAYFFSEDARFFGPNDVANRERHWWGVELPPKLRETIISEGRAALVEADIVGIPSIYRFIRDTSERSTSLRDGVTGRGLVEVLLGVEEAISPLAILSEDKINIPLFGTPEDLASLCEKAEGVVIVSSVQADVLPPRIMELGPTVIALPTHHRTSTNANYIASEEPLPFVYEDILKDVQAVSKPGALVLVAGGIIGKTFVGAAKRRGAVAIDIGSVIDDWVAGSMSSLR